MLPEIGASELMVIAAVALIVVGPKDLPLLLRKLGQFVARLRGMANDFRSSFDEMARQSELDELRREVAAMRSGQLPTSLSADDGSVDRTFQDIDASLNDRPLYDPELQQDYGPVAAMAEPEVAPDPAPKRVRKSPPKPKAVVEASETPAPKPTRSRAKAPAAKPASTKSASTKAGKAKA